MKVSADGVTAPSSKTKASKVLLHCDWSAKSSWLRGLQDVGLDVELWPDVEQPEQIGFVVCWSVALLISALQLHSSVSLHPSAHAFDIGRLPQEPA